MICWFAGQPTIFMYIHTSTGEKTVYWVVIRQIGGLFNQHNATNSKSFTGQLLYLLDYRAYTWQITAKSRTNVHLADNNSYNSIQSAKKELADVEKQDEAELSLKEALEHQFVVAVKKYKVQCATNSVSKEKYQVGVQSIVKAYQRKAGEKQLNIDFASLLA